MSAQTAPRKYAAALLRELPAADSEKAWAVLAALAQALAQVPAFGIFLAHPRIPHAEKESFLQEVLQKLGAPALAQRFVMLLLEQGQLSEVPLMAKQLRAEIDAAQGVQAAEVFSAAALSEAQKKRLSTDLTLRLKSPVRLSYELDPSLLGGILVRTNDRVLDGSVKGRFEALRQKLLAD